MKKLILSFFFLSLSFLLQAQSAANYTLTTNMTGSLQVDMLGRPIDMSSGTVALIGGNTNDARSPLVDIGFTFHFLYDVNGQELRHTKFSANSNGRMRLGYFEGSNHYTVGQKNVTGAIGPMVRNLKVHSTGKVHYKLFGVAPDRCLVVEWKNMSMDASSTTADATFQARLYETTGVVEFVYGEMMLGTGANTDNYMVGISNHNSNNRYLTVLTSDHSTSSTTLLKNTYTAGAAIPNLHSTTDGSRRVYQFTPNTPADPTALAYSNGDCRSVQLNWVDNASDEVAYEVFIADNAVGPFEYYGKTNKNATSFTARALQESTDYFFRVHALSEGQASTDVDLGMYTTTASCGTCQTREAGDWSKATTWACGRVPTSSDHVVILHNVRVDNSPSVGSIEVKAGGQVYFADINSRNMKVYGSVTVESGGSFISAQDHSSELYLWGSLHVDGEFDTNRGSKGTRVRMQGVEDATITGTGFICDFYQLEINKGTTPDILVDIQRKISLREITGDAQSLYIYNGTLKLSSEMSLAAYSGNRGDICGLRGGLWLNHPDAEIKHVTDTRSYRLWNFILDAGKLTNAAGMSFYGTATINAGEVDATGGTISSSSIFILNNGVVKANHFIDYDKFTMNAGELILSTDLTIHGYSKGESEVVGGTLTIGDDVFIRQEFNIAGGVWSVADLFLVEADSGGEYGKASFTNANLTIGGNFEVRNNASFTMLSGTIEAGKGSQLLYLRNGSEFVMNGGTFTQYGRLYSEESSTNFVKFTMTNGNLNIDPQHTTNVINSDVVYFSNHSIVNFTGGTMTIVDPQIEKNRHHRCELEVIGVGNVKNFMGSTIRFGDGSSEAVQTSVSGERGFKISANAAVQFDNLIVNNTFLSPDRVLVLHSSVSSTSNIRNLSLQTALSEVKISGNTLNVSGNIINNGKIDGTVNNSHLKFIGSTAQSYSGAGSVTDYFKEITFENTSPTGVTLNAKLGANSVHINDGYVYTDTNKELIVHGSSVTALDGFSEIAYVKGPLTRAIPNNASALNYLFPVGSVNYRLLELIELSSSGTGIGYITAQVKEPIDMNGKAGGAGLFDPIKAESIHWELNTNLGAVVLDNINAVQIKYANPATIPPRVLGQSNTGIDGSYIGIEKQIVGDKLKSSSFNLTGLIPTGTAYIVVAEVEPLEGTYTIGESVSADFQNLTALAEELRIKYVNDNVKVELLDDYDPNTETLPILFNKLMVTQESFDLTIYPKNTAKSISLAPTTDDQALIILDNVKRLKFDGRIAATGSTRNWTITNARLFNPGPAVELRNGSSLNAFRYLSLKSDNTNSTSGVLSFGIANVSEGNDNNIIENCAISGNIASPTNGVFSLGTASIPNTANTISACDIFNFFHASSSSHGIFLTGGNTNWTLSNNNLYQENPNIFTGSGVFYGIRIADGDNHKVEGNYIGGGANNHSGFTDISGSTGKFIGIDLSVKNTNATQVFSNTISKIKFSSSNTNDYPGAFAGLVVRTGNVIVGDVGKSNTIGSSGNFAEHPIQITLPADNVRVSGIETLSDQPTIIHHNKIGGVKINGDHQIRFTGIRTNRDVVNAKFSILNNTVGSTTQAHSIHLGELGYTDYCYANGITNYRSGNISITNNTIQNITSFTSNSNWNTTVRGIYAQNDKQIITGNTIANLTSYSRSYGSGTVASVIGIVKTSTSTNQQISDNTIHSLQNVNTNNRTFVTGIITRGSSAVSDSINRNKISNLSAEKANATISGIAITDGVAYVSNNMIALGYNASGNTIDKAIRFYGIEYTSPKDCNFLYNSVYIGGTGVATQADVHTYAMYKKETALSIIQNNIWVNERSNTLGDESKHYAYYLSYEDVVRSDYNIFYAPGTGGVLANYDGVDLLSLRKMQSYSSREDLHSGVGNPMFINPAGSAATSSLFLAANTPAYNTGVILNSIVRDISNLANVRSGVNGEATNIGADGRTLTSDASMDIFSPNYDFVSIEPQNCGITTVDLDIIITDQGVGIPTVGANVPSLWYRDEENAWSTAVQVQGTLLSGDAKEGTWRFSLSGLSDVKMYQYYIVAQDEALTPNISYSRFNDNSPIHSSVNLSTTEPNAEVEIDAFSVCKFPKKIYTVGNATDCPTCDFENLTGVSGFFYNMNAMLIDQNVTCEIFANTNEPGTYPLRDVKDFPNTEEFKIQIIPTASLANKATINGDVGLNKKLIRLEGAKNTVIDGQKTGDKLRWLEFAHEKNDQTVFYFVDDAQKNTIRYAEMRASAELTPRGVVFFDTTAVATPTGNSYNTIENCKITSHTQTPQNLIYSQGTVAAANTNNIIRANEMSDFKFNGIWITDVGNGDSWTIDENTLFNPTTCTTREQNGFLIEGGGNHHIVGNKIGGNKLDGSGLWENSDRYAHLNGVYINSTSTTISEVSNNTIQNISTSHPNQSGDELRGIYIVSGKANIDSNRFSNLQQHRNTNLEVVRYDGASGISISDNIIENITYSGTADFLGIRIQSDDNNADNQIYNNTIRAITLSSISSNTDFYGIYSGYGAHDLIGNTLGGNNISDKILYQAKGNFYGIYMYSGSAFRFNQNHFENIEVTNAKRVRLLLLGNVRDNVDLPFDSNFADKLTLNSTNNLELFYIADGKTIVTNNTIGTLSGGIQSSADARFVGMYFSTNDNGVLASNNSFTNIVSENSDMYCMYFPDENRPFYVNQNTISGISVPHNINFTGIQINRGNNFRVDGNNIHSISFPNSDNSKVIAGIWVQGGSGTIGSLSANTIGLVAKPISAPTATVTGIRSETGSTLRIENNRFSGLNSNLFVSAIATEGSTSGRFINNDISQLESTTKIAGIWINGGTSNTISIQSNKIHQFNLSGTTTFAGIEIQQGKVNIGNQYANYIGHNSTANSITNTGSGALYGIRMHSSATASGNKISNNVIANITSVNNAPLVGIQLAAGNSSASFANNNNIRDILTSGTGNYSVSGIHLISGAWNLGTTASNTIGENIVYNGAENLIGIHSTNSNTHNIQRNTIDGLRLNSTAATASLFGVWHTGTGASNIIANSIQNIESSSTNTNNTGQNLAVQGIAYHANSTGGSISNNRINNIRSTVVAAASTTVAGISVSSANNLLVERNLIHNLQNASSANTAQKTGIRLGTTTGTITTANNMIAIGKIANQKVRGILLNEPSTGTHQLYYNTVYISGVSVVPSYALLREAIAGNVDAKNNILYNTSGVDHFAVGNLFAAGWSSDYNNLFSANANSTISWLGTSGDLSTWQAAAQGTNSHDVSVTFIDAENANLHIDPTNNCDINGRALPITVLNDFDGTTRRTTRPDLGAHEFQPTGGNELADFWTGAEGTAWENPLNWGCDLIPLSTTAISLDATTNDPEVNGPAIAIGASIEQEAGATLQVLDEQSLSISGNGIFNGSVITGLKTSFQIQGNASFANQVDIGTEAMFQIGANATFASDVKVGYVGQLTTGGDLSFSGNLILDPQSTLLESGNLIGNKPVEVRLRLGGYKSRLFTVPLPNQSTDLVTKLTGSKTDYWNDRLFFFDEENSVATDLSNRNLDWKNPFADEDTPGNFDVTRGYSMFYNDNHTIGFSGTLDQLHSGDFTYTITNQGENIYKGYNLVGNPYPSAISANDFIDANAATIDGTIYFWDDDQSTGEYYDYSDFATWNRAGTVPGGVTSVNGGIPNGKISSLQGFFVKVSDGITATTADLHFHKTMRIANTTQFFKKKQNTIQRFRFSVSGNDSYNEALIAFLEGATDQFDKLYDGKKLKAHSQVALYSTLGADSYAIQSFAPFADTDTTDRIIPIGIDLASGGNYQLSSKSFELLEGINVYLLDKKLQKIHLFNHSESYNFEAEAGTVTNRFELIFTRKTWNQDMLNLAFEKNPKIYAVRNIIHVDLSTFGENEGSIEVFNTKGLLIQQHRFKNQYQIQLPTTSNSGLYIVRVLNNGKYYSQQIMLTQ